MKKLLFIIPVLIFGLIFTSGLTLAQEEEATETSQEEATPEPTEEATEETEATEEATQEATDEAEAEPTAEATAEPAAESNTLELNGSEPGALDQMLSLWYLNFASAGASVLALIGLIVVFATRQPGDQSTLWLFVGLAALVLTIPANLITFSMDDIDREILETFLNNRAAVEQAVDSGLLGLLNEVGRELGVADELGLSADDAVFTTDAAGNLNLFFYLSAGGLLLAIIALAGHLTTRGGQQEAYDAYGQYDQTGSFDQYPEASPSGAFPNPPATEYVAPPPGAAPDFNTGGFGGAQPPTGEQQSGGYTLPGQMPGSAPTGGFPPPTQPAQAGAAPTSGLPPAPQPPQSAPGGHPRTEQIDLSGQSQSQGQGVTGSVGGGAPPKTELLNAPVTNVNAWLVVKEGGRNGKIYQLAPNRATLGRDASTCDIVLDDTAVSRQHAKIRLLKNDQDGEDFVVQDLATANGTEVNGNEIVKHTLQDGDEIKLGRIVLVFKQI